MFNSIESVKQIVIRNTSIIQSLKDKEKYYAHTCIGRESELLEEHQRLVNEYFISICETLQLDRVIDKLIVIYSRDCSSGTISENAIKMLKELFCDAVIFHDFGKTNVNFQADPNKMNNFFFKNHKSPIGTNHSLLSEFLYITFHLSKIENCTKKPAEHYLLIYSILAFAYPIAKHHASSLLNQSDNYGFDEEFISYMEKYITNFRWDIQEPFRTKFVERSLLQCKLFSRLGELHSNMQTEVPLYGLIKLCSSLLTTSDYLATTHYMSGWTKMYDEYGVLNNEQKNRIIQNLKTTQPYNKVVYESLESIELVCPLQKSNNNLNCLRSEMAVEVIRNIRNIANNRLFYIEAPTGGGKTNLSMIALAELLDHDMKANESSINKVFYVFPFTTLATQTYSALKKTLGLHETEIIELHSKSGFNDKEDDDKYGDNRRSYLDGLFVNYPIVVTSHIKFFDILTTNKKEANYLLHRIANSIVIIDELQSYSPEQWDKLIYLIDNYAEFFNIKFILMSATLPKIGKLTWTEKLPEFVSLISDKNKYFQNENFKGRVRFDFSLLKWSRPNSKEDQKEMYLPKLCDKLFEESGQYAKRTGNVFTIVEFIFKRTASDFYEIAKRMNNGFFNRIFVLSGTILEPRRREIIEFIKDKNNRDKNILLITTQVVEAGVDIDMDLGFKDKSLVDSDEQLAGRINRNVNKEDCVLFIFDCDDARFIYGKDKRYEIIKNTEQEEYEYILKNKNFDIVYDKIIADRIKHNEGLMNIGLSNFREAIKCLNFAEVEKTFKLIKDQNYSVFVQLDIPVIIPGTDKYNFSKSELFFLEEFEKYIEQEEFVSGARVWTLYKEIIQSKSDDFIEQRIKLKKVQSILSKFVFSIFAQSEDVKRLIERGYKDDDLGFICITDTSNKDNSIYNYESGLVDEGLNGALIF